jgi:zinc protease
VKKRLLSIAACVVCLLLSVSAQDAASAAKQVTEFDVNGLKVIVKRRPGTPTVAAGLFLRGGTRVLTPDNAGIENFMLNVATEASRAFPRTALRRELASIGSVVGSSSGYDYSVISLTSTLRNFDRTWRIFTDVATDPLFAAEDVELTRGKILTSLQTREDNPDTALQMLVDRTILGGTSYGAGPHGTVETVRRFTRQDLMAYHKSAMVTSRLLLVIVGDIDAARARQMATAAFGKLARGNFTGPAVPSLDFSRPTLDVTKRSLQTNYVNGIFAAPSLKDPDHAAMRAAVSILQSRVFQEVRVKRNLSYAPDASLGSLAANTGAIYVTAVDANQAVRVMLDEMTRLRNEVLTEGQIVGISGYFLTTHFLGQETNAAQVRDLGQYELIGGGWRNSVDFLDRMRAVRPEDIQAAARKYMRNVRFFVVGDPAAIDRSIFLTQN